MSSTGAALQVHLARGVTTVCRAWLITRRDGQTLGFTDHDDDLSFEGHLFKASTGLTASALAQSTGLAVDNGETLGALSEAGLSEVDLRAGRFDGAEVRCWLVNWRDVSERALQFRGSIGEISHSGGAFRAELRGLTEALNQPQGRAYQRDCAAVLGDRDCKVDLGDRKWSAVGEVARTEDQSRLWISGLGAYPSGWFKGGRFVPSSGAAVGLVGLVKTDQALAEGGRIVELWQDMPAPIEIGDTVRLEAGCDKRQATCAGKFDNALNFRGFPHIPGEDWLSAFPSSRRVNDGGKRAG